MQGKFTTDCDGSVRHEKWQEPAGTLSMALTAYRPLGPCGPLGRLGPCGPLGPWDLSGSLTFSDQTPHEQVRFCAETFPHQVVVVLMVVTRWLFHCATGRQGWARDLPTCPLIHLSGLWKELFQSSRVTPVCGQIREKCLVLCTPTAIERAHTLGVPRKGVKLLPHRAFERRRLVLVRFTMVSFHGALGD